MTFLKDDLPGPFKPQDQNLNSHLLPLFVSYRSNGEKLIKYQVNSSCVIMFIILITTLFYKALILQGEIWCWSLLGLKGLKVTCPAKNSTGPGLLDRTFLESCNVWLGLQRHWHISEPWVFFDNTNIDIWTKISWCHNTQRYAASTNLCNHRWSLKCLAQALFLALVKIYTWLKQVKKQKIYALHASHFVIFIWTKKCKCTIWHLSVVKSCVP